MPPSFDPTKPVQTRDGWPARILCTDFKSSKSLVAAIKYPYPDSEAIQYYNPDGRVYLNQESGLDLINVPVKHTGWMNMYNVNTDYCSIKLHPSKEAADKAASNHHGVPDPKRLACIKVEFTEGEGLP